ncbi:MAG: response regulator [Ferruginibacter sp.]
MLEIPANRYSILLADDDLDDCMFFKDALQELPIATSLAVVNNGVDLMNFLKRDPIHLPHQLFLDLNMPLKKGIECLSEIKHHENLKELPVIIYSTSLNQEVVELLYKNGAQYYIKKPADFKDLKSVINKALLLSKWEEIIQPPKEEFVIQP